MFFLIFLICLYVWLFNSINFYLTLFFHHCLTSHQKKNVFSLFRYSLIVNNLCLFPLFVLSFCHSLPLFTAILFSIKCSHLNFYLPLSLFHPIFPHCSTKFSSFIRVKFSVDNHSLSLQRTMVSHAYLKHAVIWKCFWMRLYRCSHGTQTSWYSYFSKIQTLSCFVILLFV